MSPAKPKKTATTKDAVKPSPALFESPGHRCLDLSEGDVVIVPQAVTRSSQFQQVFGE